MATEDSSSAEVKNWISRSLEFATFLYLYLTICGIVSEHIYYSNFGINISDFIEVSEIVFLVFDDLIKFVLAIIMGYAFTVTLEVAFSILIFFINIIFNIRLLHRNKWNALTQEEKKKLTPEKTSKWYYQLLIAVIMLLVLYLSNEISAESRWAIAIGVLSNYIIKVRDNIYLRNTGIAISMIALAAIIVVYPMTKKEIVVENKEHIKIILSDGTEYNTGDKWLYLGSTKNYSIIYNHFDSVSTIINRKDVKFMLFPNNKEKASYEP